MKGTDADLRSEYEELAERRRNQSGNKVRADGEKRFRAVQAQNLLGKPEWDWLLANLSEKLSDRRGRLAETHRRLVAEVVLNDSALRALREQALMAGAEIRLLEEILQMPVKAIEAVQTPEPDDAA